jgi:hypothetical protein
VLAGSMSSGGRRSSRTPPPASASASSVAGPRLGASVRIASRTCPAAGSPVTPVTSTSDTSTPVSAPKSRLPANTLAGKVTDAATPTTNPMAGNPPTVPSGSTGCGPSAPGTRTGGPSRPATVATVSAPTWSMTAMRNGERSIRTRCPSPASSTIGAADAGGAAASDGGATAIPTAPAAVPTTEAPRNLRRFTLPITASLPFCGSPQWYRCQHLHDRISAPRRPGNLL